MVGVPVGVLVGGAGVWVVVGVAVAVLVGEAVGVRVGRGVKVEVGRTGVGVGEGPKASREAVLGWKGTQLVIMTARPAPITTLQKRRPQWVLKRWGLAPQRGHIFNPRRSRVPQVRQRKCLFLQPILRQDAHHKGVER